MLRRLLDRIVCALFVASRAPLRALPHRAGLALGAWLGRAIVRLRGARTGVALESLRIAFPDWSEARRHGVLEAAFANLGRSAFETTQLHRITREDVRARVTLEGVENLERARKRSENGGVILLTAHFGSFELMAVACALYGFPIVLVHRTFTNLPFDRIVTGWRERAGIRVLRRDSAARPALRALREGALLAVPLDQNARRRVGIFVPFFDRPACTRDAPARIAMRFGTPVVPVFMVRRADGERHVVRIGPEVPIDQAGDDPDAALRDNVRRMSRVIEDAIRERPDHWIWMHRRWKTQPGETPAGSTAPT